MLRVKIMLVALLVCAACNFPSQQPASPTSPVHSPTPIIASISTPTFTLVPSWTPRPIATSTPTPAATSILWVSAATPLPADLEPIRVENAARISALAEWKEDSLSDMTWTPDGRTLIVAAHSRIAFYDPLTRQVIRELYPQATPLVDIDISSLGNWFISGSREGSEEKGFVSRLELWQGPGWKPRGLLYDIPLAIGSLAFSPDGQDLTVAYSSHIVENNQIHFWDVSRWQITETLQTGPLLNIAYSPDGELLAASPDQYAIKILDVGKKDWIYNLLTSFTGSANTFAFSPDNLKLASGHYDGSIRVWDLRTGTLLMKLSSTEVIQSLAFSPDGRMLASGGSYDSQLVRLWDVSTGVMLRELAGHTSGVTHLLFSPASQFLVSGSYDGTLRIWGIRP